MKNTVTPLLLQLRFAFKSANKTIRTKNSLGLALLLLITVLFSAGTGYAADAPIDSNQQQCNTFALTGSANFAGRPSNNATVAVDASGTPYVLFRDALNGNRGTVMKYNGTSWVTVGNPGFTAGPMEPAWGEGEAVYSSLAVDDLGTAYIIYANANEYDKAYVMKYDGSTWVDISGSMVSHESHVRMKVTIGPGNTPYIAYLDYATDSGFTAVLKYNGTDWDSVGTIRTLAYYAIYDMKFDNVGIPYVAAYDSNYTACVLKLNGTNWELLGASGLSSGYPMNLCLAIDRNDVPYIGYWDSDGPYPPIASVVKKYNGSNWENVGEVGLGLGPDFLLTSITIDSAGTLFAGCVVGTNEWAPEVLKYNGSAWEYTHKDGPPAAIGQAARVYLASNKGHTFMLYDDRNTDIHSVRKLYTTPVITGTINEICKGSSLTLSNEQSGGTWASGNNYSATVGSANGVVTGLNYGGATISYVPPAGCPSTYKVTIDANAKPITGLSTVNVGGRIILLDSAAGGVWSSSNTGVATISTSGMVTGMGSGTATISYSLSNICGTSVATKTITVDVTPPACKTWWRVGAPIVGDTGTATNDVVIRTDATGTPYVLFSSAGACVSKFNGSTWEPVGSPNFAGNIRPGSASMALDNNGNPYVAFADASMGNKMHVLKFNGTTWETLSGGDLSDEPQTAGTDIAIDRNGTVYVGYNVVNNFHYEFVIDRYTGSAWQELAHGGFTTFTISGPLTRGSLKLDNNGDLNFTYVNSYGSDFGYSPHDDVNIIKYNGNNWDTVGTHINSNNGSNPAIAIDGGGTRYVAFLDGGYDFKLSVMKYNGNTWEYVGTPGFAPGTLYYQYNLRIDVDAAGMPYVIWAISDEEKYAMRFDGSAWINVANTSFLLSLTPDFTAGGSGDPYIADNQFYAVAGRLQPGIAPITGATGTCTGATTTLANATMGGTWSSSNTAVATVSINNGYANLLAMNFGSAVVTGVASGTATISYSVTTDCGILTATTIVAIDASSAGTITGTTAICTGTNTTLANATSGGTWSSSNSPVATIGSTTGIVTGIAPGNTNITYAVTNSCGTATTIKVITVNAMPDAGTITGTSGLSTGATITLANAATGGSWTSSATAIATVGTTSGIVNGISAGAVTISYSITTSCGTAVATKAVTVTTGGISGTLATCTGSVTTLSSPGGGTWSSGNAAVALAGGTTGVVTGVAAGTATITYNLAGGTTVTIVTVNAAPANITGTMKACPGTVTTLADAATGGTWTSSNISTATVDAATGVVTGVAAGSVSISYTNTAGCSKIANVTINPNPSVIMGTLSACTGSNATLSDATGGGMSWTSSNTAVATVNALSGVVTAVATGTSTITYTVSSGCMTTATFTVNSLPPAITGTLKTCAGTTTSLSDAATGGTWTSSYLAVGTVNTTGVVAGIAGGTTTITYSMGAGCNRTAVVTISPLPTAIMGTPATCTGATATLSNVGTGTWSSSDMGVATVGASGIIAGVAPGTATISYTVASGCAASVIATVSTAPSASTGAATVCMGSTTTLANATTGGTWASSNNGIATVGSLSGIVTTLSSTGTINITYSLGGSCRTVKNITINAIPNAITGTASICAGAATTLSSSSTGTWSSSNMTVGSIGSISVVSGRFVSLSAGTSTITYAFATGCARTTVVTVNPAPNAGAITSSGGFVINTATPPTSVMLSSTGDAGGAWTSNNTTVATIDGTGTVTAAHAGTANISYTVTLGSCTARATHTVNVVAARAVTATGSSTSSMTNVSIYPNPNSGVFTLKGMITTDATQAAVEVTNMAGQVVLRNNAVITDGIINEQIHLNANLANGMYMLTLRSGEETKVFHFVVNQ